MLKPANRVLISCSILCACLLYGCAAVIIGAAAAGAGAFAYSEGRLSRVYESGYNETVLASIDTLESLKIPVKDKTADELKTNIFAERPDGTPVNVEVKRISPKYTEVAIRTGKLGVFDQKISYQIHDYILNRIREKTVVSIDTQDQSTQKAPEPAIEISEPKSRPKTSTNSKFYQSKKLSVYFDVNTNMLSEKETDKLDRFISTLKMRPTEKLVLVGYSDATGTATYNKMISLSRAETVKMYLVGKGMSPNQIETFGHGSLNFVGNNATKEGRRLNRRVEIYLDQE